MTSTVLGKHRGCVVFVNAIGEFYTLPDSEYGEHRATTFQALKKKVDGAGAVTQGPAKAFVILENYSDPTPKVFKVKCGRIIQTRFSKEVWVTDEKGDRSKHNANAVYFDTAENWNLAAKYVEARIQQRKADDLARELETRMVSINEEGKA